MKNVESIRIYLGLGICLLLGGSLTNAHAGISTATKTSRSSFIYDSQGNPQDYCEDAINAARLAAAQGCWSGYSRDISVRTHPDVEIISTNRGRGREAYVYSCTATVAVQCRL